MTVIHTGAATAGSAAVQAAHNWQAAEQREQVALANENEQGMGAAIMAIRERCEKAGHARTWCPECGGKLIHVTMNMGRDTQYACGPCGRFF